MNMQPQQQSNLIKARYETPILSFGDNRHHVGSQLDEADSLMLGLEKSIMAEKPWATEAIVSTSCNLDGYIGKACDFFETYPPIFLDNKDAEIKSFLDQVLPPTQLEPPFDPTKSNFSEPQQNNDKNNDKKRVLEEPSFTYAIIATPARKRSRLCNVVEVGDESSAEGDAHPKFRDYQEQQWQEQFQGLLEYKAKHGHCCVPNSYDPNPTLGRWVKRQRYQYKLKQAGHQSTLVASRVRALESVGFVWDSHAALWEERLNELKTYRNAYRHCNVPSSYPKNKQLSTWVKCQRRQYKLFCKGKNSNLTEERIASLGNLGFVWDGRTIENRCKSVFQRSRPQRAPLSTRSTIHSN